jgi:hypothetical protein
MLNGVKERLVASMVVGGVVLGPITAEHAIGAMDNDGWIVMVMVLPFHDHRAVGCVDLDVFLCCESWEMIESSHILYWESVL